MLPHARALAAGDEAERFALAHDQIGYFEPQYLPVGGG
jgi:hypothetical protein